MTIEIDPFAGFCFGVKKAIDAAEKELAKGALYALGEVVHNHEEVKRLEQKGLKTITYADLDRSTGDCVFIRTHGEPPTTFKSAEIQGHILIDATCPVVRKLQDRVRKASEAGRKDGTQVIIYGKKTHAEVIGLVGHSGNYAKVVETIDELGFIDPSRPVVLFAQTTMHPVGLEKIASAIQAILAQQDVEFTQVLTIHNTICRQVSGREESMREFAKSHDILLFIAGANSSNGKMLFSWAKESNPHAYYLASPGELQKEWFERAGSIGISGATSTPQWLMEEVKERVKELVSG